MTDIIFLHLTTIFLFLISDQLIILCLAEVFALANGWHVLRNISQFFTFGSHI